MSQITKKQILATVMAALQNTSEAELQTMAKQLNTPAAKPAPDTVALAKEVKAMVVAQYGNPKPGTPLVQLSRKDVKDTPIKVDVKKLPAGSIQAMAEQIAEAVLAELQPMSLAETAARNAKR